LTEIAKKVLVTGGAGFIGSHVVDRLVDCGYSVRVVDNLSAGRLKNISGHLATGKVEFIEGDIRDTSIIERCVEDVGLVVHLAAETSVAFSFENPNMTYKVNIEGTLNLLRSCAKAKVRKLLFASSCAVYGKPVFLPLTEEHPTEPISPYAASKLAAEQFCLGFHETGLLSTVVLRLFNVYGPRQALNDYSGVITRFVDSCRRGFPLVVYGDGSQTRDFIHVSDVVDSVIAALGIDDLDGEVFNVGYGVQTSISELAETLLELAGLNLEIVYDSPRVGDIIHSCADITKIEKMLGYRPRLGLRDGLRTLLVENTLLASKIP
jgi:UDP-glucose 4-epimerase